MSDIVVRFIGICEYVFEYAIDQAQQYCDRALALAIELGIPLVKECEALMEEINQQRE